MTRILYLQRSQLLDPDFNNIYGWVKRENKLIFIYSKNKKSFFHDLIFSSPQRPPPFYHPVDDRPFNIAFTLQYFLSHIFRYFSFGNFASETQEMQTEAK
uniref:Uncharacterized protein n=1 Tax=Heterorhabditis bacteriophora TaxID=37862 RepID=A0A1I7WGQ6_HETBA